ncbi:hypothetical protein [Paenibacillus lentus]|uniref:Uncharacterized protein n=1 Tax=Paenibacillus lentus TaxID=1338368 RepID=A0A3Q8SB44_9BACL|nr:hypothetical protein [Paenibacillus lentus]AZK46691.1 hypothetical protein EIM92_11445 [Paenibacillus lentus]
MENIDEVFGAYAQVFIQYEGILQDLGLKIEEGLDIPSLRYENLEDEPYELVGYTEVFGFEIELCAMLDNEKWPNYQFSLKATTTDSFQEIMNNRMFDISLWLARYISLMCEVTTMAENVDKQTGQSFYYNNTTLKRECSFIKGEK